MLSLRRVSVNYADSADMDCLKTAILATSATWRDRTLLHGGIGGVSTCCPARFRPDERIFILHADDSGMCHSANAATIRAMSEGVVSSTSVMVPCPWFPEMAAWAREHPEMDVGVHLTLTSEWRHYRWGPVAPREQVPGLVDEEGFLWRRVEDVIAHASPQEVEIEVRAQIERALRFGIKPTHIDSHMGTLFAHPEYFEIYVRLSREYGIPAMLPRPTPQQTQMMGGIGWIAEQIAALESAGLSFPRPPHSFAPGRLLKKGAKASTRPFETLSRASPNSSSTC